MILLISALSLLMFCSPKQDEVKRIMEDGVEVVFNHLEPYNIEEEPNILHLEKKFTIDTEKYDITKIGLTDIQGFDVDSEDNIYFFLPPLSPEKLIYKFDKDGNFIASFGQKGQGPGELQHAYYQRITIDDEIPIVSGRKLLFFDSEGNFIKEKNFELGVVAGGLFPLGNGNFLMRTFEGMTRGPIDSPPEDDDILLLSITNSELRTLKVIDVLRLNRLLLAMRSVHLMPVYFWEVSHGNIYIGNNRWGYEIRVFDLNGNLLKKIKKEYKPVKFPKEIRDEFKRANRVTPENQPPFQRLFFTDDDGRLFLMTFEKGENPNEYMFDIFNSDGIFIAKKSLDIYVERFTGNFPLYAKAKNKRLYCLKEKSSGYKELVVYKMNWE